MWVISPDGRNRSKNEEVPEKAIITKLNFAGTEVRSKLFSGVITRRASSNSAESLDTHSPKTDSLLTSTANRRSTRGAVKGTGFLTEGSELSKKRKNDESNNSNINSPKSRKVSFHLGDYPKDKMAVKDKSLYGLGTSTHGKRSNVKGPMVELPAVTKTKTKKAVNTSAVLKVKKDEKVEVIKMLTGTLYLYRGECRRAEFIRSR